MEDPKGRNDTGPIDKKEARPRSFAAFFIFITIIIGILALWIVLQWIGFGLWLGLSWTGYVILLISLNTSKIRPFIFYILP